MNPLIATAGLCLSIIQTPKDENKIKPLHSFIITIIIAVRCKHVSSFDVIILYIYY